MAVRSDPDYLIVYYSNRAQTPVMLINTSQNKVNEEKMSIQIPNQVARYLYFREKGSFKKLTSFFTF